VRPVADEVAELKTGDGVPVVVADPGGRRRHPGGSTAWGGERESEGQPDWRWVAHGGELTEAAATTMMAASKLATPACLRRSVRMRCKRAARWRSCAVQLRKKWCEEERG
jgi:hypothetical protein